MIKILISNMNLTRFALIISLAVLSLSACQSLVPATVPPQLSHTPGLPLNITEDHIESEQFVLSYPGGWRIVSSVAIEPLRLTLVSPDEDMIITIQETDEQCPEIPPTPQVNNYSRDVCAGNLHVSGTSENENQAIFDTIFDDILNSVIFR